MKAGIERAAGTYVMCDEIDLCDVDFISALALWNPDKRTWSSVPKR